jgi:hypothetical protein
LKNLKTGVYLSYRTAESDDPIQTASLKRKLTMSETSHDSTEAENLAAELMTHAARLATSLPDGKLTLSDGKVISVRRNITDDKEEVVVSSREKTSDYTNLAFFIVNVTNPNLQVARFGMQREDSYLEKHDFDGLARYHEEIYRDALLVHQEADIKDLDVAISLMRGAGARVMYRMAETS